MVIEYVDGEPLLDYINEYSRLREYEAQPIFCELVSAVHYLHKTKNIVHRDLKIDNCVLALGNHIKLIDFNFAYHYTGPATEQLVSFPYGAPEIFLGRPYAHPIDIWSLGVMLYVMVCGEFPFGSDSTDEVAQRVVRSRPVYPDHLSGEIKSLFDAMFEKDPAKRIDITGVRSHNWLQNGRCSLLMHEELFLKPEFRTLPSVNEDIDVTILELMRRCGCQQELTVADFFTSDNEGAMVYRIVRRMSVGRILPLYCQSLLMEKTALLSKSNSVDPGRFLRHYLESAQEAESSVLADPAVGA
jgi:serine/threonine protein kinase